jgi:hypothetical protein
VAQALRSVRTAAQKSLKGLNQVASQRMAKGDYVTAEVLAAKGKEIRQFESEVDELQKRWREVCGIGGRASKKPITPLWVYFQPILQALASIGGECQRADLEAHVERLMGASLQPGDREGSARGRERWRLMVPRARKPLIAEGWIEDRTGKIWRITDAGRRAAEKPIGKDAGLHR